MCSCLRGFVLQAENLLREQLKINESALLWCLLGDTLKVHGIIVVTYEVSTLSRVQTGTDVRISLTLRFEFSVSLLKSLFLCF